MRVIYLGTPQFAVESLKALLETEGIEVVACVTQPDRPKGRGGKIEAPPVKILAQAHNIPVLQPEKLSRDKATVEAMKALQPDILVMVAFGQILKKEVLTMTPMGVVNVHGSLLPKLRGAAPINWSIINGDTVTGVTTMFTNQGVDSGPMLLKKEIAITPQMDSEELSQLMSVVGAQVLIETLQKLKDGTLKAEEQDESQVTFAPLLCKDLGILDFSRPASALHNLVRGLKPWPATTCKFRGQDLKILRTDIYSDTIDGHWPCGQTKVHKSEGKTHILVACGESTWLELLEVQPPNKAKMKASDWANGIRLEGQECLS